MSTIKFPIADPTFYYSQGDEDRFYGCLYELPEYVEVRWDGAALQLELATPVSADSFMELIALFARYEVPLRMLRPVIATLSEESLASFANEQRFWFKDLFGADE